MEYPTITEQSTQLCISQITNTQLDSIFQFLPRDITLRIVAWKKRIEYLQWKRDKEIMDTSPIMCRFRAEFTALIAYDKIDLTREMIKYFINSYVESSKFRDYLNKLIISDKNLLASQLYRYTTALEHIGMYKRLTDEDKNWILNKDIAASYTIYVESRRAALKIFMYMQKYNSKAYDTLNAFYKRFMEIHNSKLIRRMIYTSTGEYLPLSNKSPNRRRKFFRYTLW